ncbi:MAG TPA: hypothetical protein VK176_12980, partial [Phycisphaerales bacterium]|nr:hypothetical protein [Phycisphaerales bacterium]
DEASVGPRAEEKAVEALTRLDEGNRGELNTASTGESAAKSPALEEDGHRSAADGEAAGEKRGGESAREGAKATLGAPASARRNEPAPPGREGVPGSAPKVTGTRAGASGRPGEKSDQSADPTSLLREAVDVVPGRPAAAKGLKLKTTPPQWSITTMILRSARNPVVAITFNKSGKVVRAEFLRGMDAGSAEVNGPLMDAIYEWRAEGERLKRLPEGKDAGITIVMRITLRGV